MEEHRIKSAWEIAQEKLARIPDLTSEELIKQRERECWPIGAAIAMRFLKGAIRVSDLTIELSKHHGAEGQIVRRALMSDLCQSVEPRDAVRSRRAMEGLQALVGTNSLFDEVKNEFEGIISDFDRETQQRSKAFETMEKGRLLRLGISGSAIRPNVKGNKDWQEEQSKIRQSYDMRMDKVWKTLMRLTEVV